MKGDHEIEDQIFFWSLLKVVRDDHFGPRGDWDSMSVDEVLREMMIRSKGRINPNTTRRRLEKLQRDES